MDSSFCRININNTGQQAKSQTSSNNNTISVLSQTVYMDSIDVNLKMRNGMEL
jgi:hypothetical protein